MIRSWLYTAVLFILVHVLPVPLGAQLQFERSTIIDVTKGLPTNAVYSIEKDPDGFIWMGTEEGLCRFDGTHCRVYQNDLQDSFSLFDNSAYGVQPFQGKIWVATEMGLSVLDPQTDRFTHYQMNEHGMSEGFDRGPNKQAYIFYVDPYGDLWIGTKTFGAIRFRADTKTFQFFPISESNPGFSFPVAENGLRILSITASVINDSIIYAGTPSGLLEINRINSRVKWLHFPQATPDLDLGVNSFRRLYCHDDGLVYVGSWRVGVHVYDPVRNTLLPLPLKPGPGNHILSPGIRGIARKSADEIWITTSNGLIAYHIKEQRITFWKENNLEEGLYYGIDYIDDNNRVWLRALNGVHVFDPGLQQFRVYDYKGLQPQGWSFSFYMLPGPSPAELLVLPRHDNAVYHFDLNNHTWQRFLLRVKGIYNPDTWTTRGFSRAPDGTYTISAEHGVFSYSTQTHQVRALTIPQPFPFIQYGVILWDRQGMLWICAGPDGLIRWDPRSNTTRIFRKEFLPPGTDSTMQVVRDLFLDSRGQIWIRREGGHSVYLPDRDTILNFIYAQNQDRALFEAKGFAEDRLGRIWMCSSDSWIGYADSKRPESGILYKVSLRNSLKLGEVFFLATDGKGDVWGVTAKEMVHIVADSDQINTISFDYGYSNPDNYGLQSLPNGEIVIGGRNQIILFNPEKLQRNAEQPQPYIEQIKVLGKTRLVGQDTGLYLRYWENFFSVDFSAKAYTLGNKCRFRYRLEGFEDWQEAGERRYANYTNVPGGDYVFRVQVANNEGKWSDAMLAIPVVVDTAWWITWWFRSASILLFLFLVYSAYQYRILQIRRQERVRTDFEKKLANVEMSALLAQMNPHFLFNSLNSIDSYIIRNESKKASEYLNNFARLMRLILNNSRTNYISLKDEVESLDLYLQMESLRFKDKFEYEIRVGEQIDTASINIPPMLIQPYIENAIWHGLMHKAGGGKVTVSLEQRDNNLLCTVEDNGIGRARAMELSPKRPGNNRQSMGMKITEDRIDIINKLYDANTHVTITDLHDAAGTPCGTRVVLTIPI